MKCRISTTATVQFALNYVPQHFNANAPYSLLSRIIIIQSMADTNLSGIFGLSMLENPSITITSSGPFS